MTKDEQTQLSEKLDKLQEEYKVKFSIVLTPTNLFSKIFKRIIKVNWKIIFINTK